jgi:hypothetical protein
VKICSYKKGMTTNFFFTPLFCCCFWIRDPRSGINIPVPQHCILACLNPDLGQVRQLNSDSIRLRIRKSIYRKKKQNIEVCQLNY